MNIKRHLEGIQRNLNTNWLFDDITRLLFFKNMLVILGLYKNKRVQISRGIH